MLGGLTSIIDYVLHFGLPGLIIGLIALWILTKKVDNDKRAKYIKIGSFIFIVPYILDLLFFGITSYISLMIYGSIGLSGIILSGLSIKEKLWLPGILYIAPIAMVFSTVLILGP